LFSCSSLNRFIVLFFLSETQPKPDAEMPPYGEKKDSGSSTKEGPWKEVKHVASVEKNPEIATGQQGGGAYQHEG
jgi:hypothetical protein